MTYRLPFSLYLRIAPAKWAPKHHAEFQALRLVEKHSHIPAPRPVDTCQHAESSYLLMTRVPGRPIGQILPILADETVQIVAQQLKEYLAELREIPNSLASSYQICNAVGDGVLDWRIGDAPYKEPKFKDETEFRKFLTDGVDEDTKKKAAKSHGSKHEIVFTHADLNPRNILADERGNITGIVDWECAGWYPEYWEYTKAHFAVRYVIRWLADVVDQVFPGYREELWIENMLSDLYPFGL